MSEASKKFSQPTLPGIDELTFSPEPVSGKLRQALLVGPQLDPSGPPPAPASRSRSLAKAPELMTQGICGRTYSALSEPVGPLASWENRLRARLAMVGSTESALIWREKVTPSGRSISRLAPSTRHTNGSGCIGSPWPTPTSLSHQDKSHNPPGNCSSMNRMLDMIKGTAQWPTPRASNEAATLTGTDRAGWDLPTKMATSNWPTPTVADVEGGRKTRSGSRGDEMLLNGLMSNWSTPRASDGEKGGPNMSFGAGGTPLPTQMAQAPLVTPSARDWKDSAGMATSSGDRSRMDQLPRQMAHSGPTTNGSPAQTEKRGASRGSPNPYFAAWLMGWPEWLIWEAHAAILKHKARVLKLKAQ